MNQPHNLPHHTEPNGRVVDLDKARAARTGTTPTAGPDVETDSVYAPSEAATVTIDREELARLMAAAAATTIPGARSATVGTLKEPTGPALWEKSEPVVPAWVRNRSTLLGWARAHRQRIVHTIGVHTVRRGPEHLATGAVRVARGSKKGLAALYGYLMATEYAHLSRQARETGQYDLVAALRTKRRAEIPLRFKSKRTIATTGAVLVLLGVAAWYGLMTVTVVGMAMVGMAAAFAAGRTDAPATDRAEFVEERQGPPSEDRLNRAFRDAGVLGKPGKDGTGGEVVRLVSPVIADGRKAWEVVLDLPAGKKASAAIGKREDIASALGVDEVQVHMERVRTSSGHAGRLSLWVAKENPFGGSAAKSPLVGRKSLDVWTDRIPVGVDARGRQVALSLIWAAMLVGAIPRQGKTFFMRAIALGMALDPHVRHIVANGKGDRSWKPFAKIAHRYINGAEPAKAKELADALREVQADMNRRNAFLDSLEDAQVPEDKLTRELSHRHNMPVTCISVDELQRFLDDEKHGQTILGLLVDIAKVGPSTGYILLLATQRPDANTVPPALRDVIAYRAALKVMDWRSSEVVLGAGTYGKGYDASAEELGARKGMALLVREDGIGNLIRGYLIDATDANRICDRGRELREKTGTLTGDAAGPNTGTAGTDPTRPQAEVPAWLGAAMEAMAGAGQEGMTPTALVEEILTAHPDWAGGDKPLTGRSFGLAMAKWGCGRSKRPGSPAPMYWAIDMVEAAERIANGGPVEVNAQ
ncbi:FtsK/SpoIIIE domain-containing protein [Kitasatospora sp. NPDC048365]|uniref:FtsK/SpoIIIE domain-containing protein n=1 Tax=Kitasatospora sp. NPDC048365 TaxID=3364050 RepID=UPI0037231054